MILVINHFMKSTKICRNETDEFIVMPNHVHGIICIAGTPSVGAGLVPALSFETRTGVNNRAGTRPAPTIHIIPCI